MLGRWSRVYGKTYRYLLIYNLHSKRLAGPAPVCSGKLD